MAVINKERRGLLIAAGVGAAGVALTAAGLSWGNGQPNAPLRIFGDGREWINTAPLQASDLAGKVVLVNFWTYSCINSLRTLPYLRDWARKYADRGLIVLGVHAPEFQFEHELARVRGAVASLGVSYPVVLDNDYVIWRAFNNEAWPGFFVVDRNGRIRHAAFGEETYVELERAMQACLEENGAPANDALSHPRGEGAQAAPDWSDLGSPESYVGYAKADQFTPGGGLHHGAPAHYTPARELALNQWTLSGDWNVGPEFASPAGEGSALRFRFKARDLHIVMGREVSARPVRFRIALESGAPGAAHGVDTDADGHGAIDDDRMYQVLRQPGPIASRSFEIGFLDAGARVYVFTFG